MNQLKRQLAQWRAAGLGVNELSWDGDGDDDSTTTYLLQYAPQSQQLLLELQHILDHGIPEGFIIQHQIVRRAVQLRVASSVSSSASRARSGGRQLLLLLLSTLQTRRGGGVGGGCAAALATGRGATVRRAQTVVRIVACLQLMLLILQPGAVQQARGACGQFGAASGRNSGISKPSECLANPQRLPPEICGIG